MSSLSRIRWTCLLLVLASCAGGIIGEEDVFWADTGDEASAEAALGGADRQVAISPGKVDDAELVKLLPVGQTESSAPRRVVLRLKPDELPGLMKGDRLIAPAEVQVTTRCDVGQTAAGCDYNPTVRAQLLLTGKAGDTSSTGNGTKVIATQTQSCTRGEHHCMFVFTPSSASLMLDGLPCLASRSCHLNLVMWAWDAAARAGGADQMLVGGNDGDFLANGRVEGDLARLMVVRERGLTASDRAGRETSGGGTIAVNTAAEPVLIYSHRLKPAGDRLRVGEQFLIEAKVTADTASRARFSTQLIVTRTPGATDGERLEEISPSEVSEQNGFNCSGTCVARKVAVFRVVQTTDEPLYVNLVARSAVPGGGATLVVVRRDDGWVRSVRYSATLAR